MKPLRRMLRRENGQALPMALVLMVVGVMVTTVILTLTTTNLKTTQVMDQKTRDIYAADAGIDDGLWKVRYNYLPSPLLGSWVETTYATYEENPYTYIVHDSDNPDNTVPINDRDVEVAIKPIWLLDGLEEIPTLQGRTPTDHLLTYGTIIDNGVYEISILQDGSLDPLEIQRIGCWLPPGFEYTTGSSNLEQGSGQPYYCIPVRSSYRGGWAITWDFAGIDYDDLPAQGNKKIVTFQFTPGDSDLTDAFSWTRTSRDDVKLSWDTSKRTFEITSIAPSDSEKQTTIVSHSIKKEFQALGGSISGDYQATGNTLIRDTNRNGERDRLYKETWTNIPPTTDPPTDPIPEDASVEKIFLYWSGWKCLPWDPTEAELNNLPVVKHVNEVALKVKVGANEMPRTRITAAEYQVERNTDSDDPHGWSYACFADITSTVTDYFKDQGVPFYGNATYTVGHWDISTTKINATYRYKLCNWKESHPSSECTSPPTIYYAQYPLGSPRTGSHWVYSWPSGGHWEDYTYEDEGDEDNWAYVGWSVVIIYSSPSTAGHHLYIFDEFMYCDHYQTLEFTIRGFLAPQDVENDPNAARLTCFVGEGDDTWTGDNLFLNDYRLNHDTINPINNVWNARSNVLGGADTDSGIDIDMFTAGGGTVIQAGATEATIDMPTGIDIWSLVYMILSFRSEITTGGVIDYSIK
jgi:hypothetical protein